MELISVIVPVYKVEAYLDKCVESIVNQTYKNLEIILVDDGSPDNCPLMCDEWAKKDDRIKVIHKENGGLSDARNAGMAVATGEYISFVDSDDWLTSDFLQSLYDSMKENNSDISACGVEMVWEDGTLSDNLTISGNYVLDNESAMKAIIEEDILKQPVWYKLYKRELIKDIPFPVGKYHEDVFWSYQAVARAKTVSVFDKPCYKYIQRKSSIMGETYSLKRLDGIEAAEQRCEFINERYPALVSMCKTRFISMCMYHSQQLLLTDFEEGTAVIKKLCTRARAVDLKYKKSESESLKQKLWICGYLRFPVTVCRIRNLLKVGI